VETCFADCLFNLSKCRVYLKWNTTNTLVRKKRTQCLSLSVLSCSWAFACSMPSTEEPGPGCKDLGLKQMGLFRPAKCLVGPDKRHFKIVALYPWPMANDLALLAFGLFGDDVPATRSRFSGSPCLTRNIHTVIVDVMRCDLAAAALLHIPKCTLVPLSPYNNGTCAGAKAMFIKSTRPTDRNLPLGLVRKAGVDRWLADGCHSWG